MNHEYQYPFIIGDRVRVPIHRTDMTIGGGTHAAGFCGTVVRLECGMIGVAFDSNVHGHDCGISSCPVGHGWFMTADELELEQDDCEEPANAEELAGFLGL